MLKKDNNKYVTLDRIKKEHAQYNWLIGQRSNGKSYACKLEMLKNYCQNGKQSAYLRRWREDFKGKRGQVMFDDIVKSGIISKWTKGDWDNVFYWSGRWYLCRYDENNKCIKDERPFCYAFALTEMEHDKSTSYPDITIVVFDEAISRDGYIEDEFVIFCNVLSTIIRQRNDVVVYLLGNTISKFCPYFREMGLTNVKNMQEGDLEVYSYGQSLLKVAVQFTDSVTKNGKSSDIYFAFNNPKLEMITGQGSNTWELEIYPHCPVKFNKSDIVFTYFIMFNEELLQCEIVQKTRMLFTFIHRKTTPLRNADKDLIYTIEYHAENNYRRNILNVCDDISQKVKYFYQIQKVFYQDNEVGDIISNYLKWCRQN